jgi:DNA-binding transcriptional LysR family regulator
MDKLLISVSLRRLKVFLAVCETLHMAKAAERLGVAQPALSQQILSLERALGVRLFNRRKRGIDLTSAGQACRVEAEKLLSLHAGAIDTVQRTARGEMGRVNLGYVGSAMLGRRRIPAQLKAMHEAFPDVELSLVQSSPLEMLAAVREGELDAAVVCAPVSIEAPLVYRVHSCQELVVALPPEHLLARLEKIPISLLAHETMIGIAAPADIGIMPALTELASKAGVKLQIKWQVSEFVSVLGLVAAGLGCGIVPQELALIAGPEIVFRPLEESGAHAEYWLVWHEERTTPALNRLIEMLLK